MWFAVYKWFTDLLIWYDLILEPFSRARAVPGNPIYFLGSAALLRAVWAKHRAKPRLLNLHSMQLSARVRRLVGRELAPTSGNQRTPKGADAETSRKSPSADSFIMCFSKTHRKLLTGGFCCPAFFFWIHLADFSWPGSDDDSVIESMGIPSSEQQQKWEDSSFVWLQRPPAVRWFITPSTALKCSYISCISTASIR